jgi:hypothetical protein
MKSYFCDKYNQAEYFLNIRTLDSMDSNYGPRYFFFLKADRNNTQ